VTRLDGERGSACRRASSCPNGGFALVIKSRDTDLGIARARVEAGLSPLRPPGGDLGLMFGG